MTARTAAAEGANELQIALAGDDAFESWYQRTLPRVYSYLVSRCGNDVALAEELTQQSFIAAVDQRSRYDGRSDTVTWVCGIARHKLADHFRTVERDERRRMRLEIRQIEVDRVAADDAPAFDDRPAIADALRSLPANQRAVLAFVVLDDLPVAEVARLMGKSASATQSLLHRARASFRRAYAGEIDDD
jgi:RNA polymerase sigma-70 factor (ECF subfamily)